MKTPQARMVMLVLAAASFIVGSVWELGGLLVYIIPGVLLILWIVLKVLAIIGAEVVDSVSTHRSQKKAGKLLSAVEQKPVTVTKDLSYYKPPLQPDDLQNLDKPL